MTGEVASTACMTDNLPPGEVSEGRTAALPSLAERARAGDLEAFEQVMVFTQHRVAATAWRMLGSREDARDAAQEVFLRAFKYLKGYRPGQDFHGWLHRITVNVCRDMLRKRHAAAGGLRLTSLDDETGKRALETLAGEGDAEEAAVLAQERAIVGRALAALPEKERTAIVLRDLEGLSTEEVARLMGSRPATVRSQVSTARAKVKIFCERFLRRGRS